MRDYLVLNGVYLFFLVIPVLLGVLVGWRFPSYADRCIGYLEHNSGVIVSVVGTVSSAALIVLGLAASTVDAELWDLLATENRLEGDLAIPLLILGYTVIVGAFILITTVCLGTLPNPGQVARILATTVIVMVTGLAIALTVDVYQLIKLIDLVVETTRKIN